MAATPAPRSDAELRRAAWHVTRELRLMSELYDRYLRPTPREHRPALDEAENSAMVESVLVHLRCLSEFLVGRPIDTKSPTDPRRRWRADRDICPEHFVDGWDSATLAGCPHAQPLMKVIPLCDQRISHLSWARLTDADFYTPTVRDCVGLFTDFVGHLRMKQSRWTDVFFFDETVAANRRCGWAMRFPEFLWFRLPRSSGRPKGR